MTSEQWERGQCGFGGNGCEPVIKLSRKVEVMEAKIMQNSETVKEVKGMMWKCIIGVGVVVSIIESLSVILNKVM
jgi:hypothetical protein